MAATLAAVAKAHFAGLFKAIPDFDLHDVSTATNRDRAAVRWTATGMFPGADLQGITAAWPAHADPATGDVARAARVAAPPV